MLNIISIVLGLLILFGTHFCEECCQSAETVEVELLLAHRNVQTFHHESNQATSNSTPVRPTSITRDFQEIVIAGAGERGKMNGIGTYLLV